MTNQKSATEDLRRAQPSQSAKQAGQQQAHSSAQGQQGSREDNRLFSERVGREEVGVERSKRSPAERGRNSGAPDDLLPDQKPPGWAARDV